MRQKQGKRAEEGGNFFLSFLKVCVHKFSLFRPFRYLLVKDFTWFGELVAGLPELYFLFIQ